MALKHLIQIMRAINSQGKFTDPIERHELVSVISILMHHCCNAEDISTAIDEADNEEKLNKFLDKEI